MGLQEEKGPETARLDEEKVSFLGIRGTFFFYPESVVSQSSQVNLDERIKFCLIMKPSRFHLCSNVHAIGTKSFYLGG